MGERNNPADLDSKITGVERGTSFRGRPDKLHRKGKAQRRLVKSVTSLMERESPSTSVLLVDWLTLKRIFGDF